MKEIELPKIADERGNLTFFEGERLVPFKIKGVNLLNIYNTNDQYEFVDNKNTKFFFIALSGSFVFSNDSTDDPINGRFLENANRGLYIGRNTNFTLSGFAENTVVLIVSSTEKFYLRKI